MLHNSALDSGLMDLKDFHDGVSYYLTCLSSLLNAQGLLYTLLYIQSNDIFVSSIAIHKSKVRKHDHGAARRTGNREYCYTDTLCTNLQLCSIRRSKVSEVSAQAVLRPVANVRNAFHKARSGYSPICSLPCTTFLCSVRSLLRSLAADATGCFAFFLLGAVRPC